MKKTDRSKKILKERDLRHVQRASGFALIRTPYTETTKQAKDTDLFELLSYDKNLLTSYK